MTKHSTFYLFLHTYIFINIQAEDKLLKAVFCIQSEIILKVCLYYEFF